jgi:carboxyl-terminal processing protease
MRFKRPLAAFCLSVICFVIGSGPLAAAALAAKADAPKTESKPSTPAEIYTKVWTLVKNGYFDPKYNGQNWDHWEHLFDGKLETKEDAYRAINTMLASLSDPWTRFLDPTAWKDEQLQIVAKLVGIGVQLGVDENKNVLVIEPVEGSPAAQAGILPMDKIVEVNGASTVGFPREKVSALLKGPIGTPVKVTVLRGASDRVTLDIVRDEIPIRSVVDVEMLNSQVGYVRLSTFMSEDAGKEMIAALSKLSPARGIILDLRDNQGGLVNNAITISNIFLDRGVIVYTRGRDGIDRTTFTNVKPKTGSMSHQTLVVLVNERSASASEITSGALKDNGRATLVGQKSFGKGLVQAVMKVDDESGMNITIARYLTPNGNDIHKLGITPEYVVEVKPNDLASSGPWWYSKDLYKRRKARDGSDLQLNEALSVMARKLEARPDDFKLKMPSDSIWNGM